MTIVNNTVEMIRLSVDSRLVHIALSTVPYQWEKGNIDPTTPTFFDWSFWNSKWRRGHHPTCNITACAVATTSCISDVPFQLVWQKWGWTWKCLIKFFSWWFWIAQVVHFQNLPGGLWSPLGILRNSRWRPRWPPFHEPGHNFFIFNLGWQF